MNIGICQKCEAEFEVKKGWETICLSCWIADKQANKKPSYAALEETLRSACKNIEALQRQNAELLMLIPENLRPKVPW